VIASFLYTASRPLSPKAPPPHQQRQNTISLSATHAEHLFPQKLQAKHLLSWVYFSYGSRILRILTSANLISMVTTLSMASAPSRIVLVIALVYTQGKKLHKILMISVCG
jgi:hypothetical protein